MRGYRLSMKSKNDWRKLINERELPDEVIALLRTRNQSRSKSCRDDLQ